MPQQQQSPHTQLITWTSCVRLGPVDAIDELHIYIYIDARVDASLPHTQAEINYVSTTSPVTTQLTWTGSGPI